MKLGVIPATISPYVVARIGVSNSRRLFMTGEAITSEAAVHAQLVNVIVDDDKARCGVGSWAASGGAWREGRATWEDALGGCDVGGTVTGRIAACSRIGSHGGAGRAAPRDGG